MTKKSDAANGLIGTQFFSGMPDETMEQVDNFYKGLEASAHLLEEGAKFGLVVAISPQLSALIRARNGMKSEAVLSNCLTILAHEEKSTSAEKAPRKNAKAGKTVETPDAAKPVVKVDTSF
jgi:hypothetical protein